MKTAISVPDDLFEQAERLARRLKKSRSQLYAEALAEYLARNAPDEVTEAMNRACDELGEEREDRFVSEAARHILERNDW
jgi:metal-responsive CopG/Arc/MetJ family transcriptional regulator